MINNRLRFRFINTATKETFFGTRRNFTIKYKLNYKIVFLLTQGERKSHKNWIVQKKKEKKPVRWWEHKKRDTTIYTFKNNRTGKIFVGERCEFYRKYNLGQGSVCHLIKGNRSQYKNWVLLKKEKPNANK